MPSRSSARLLEPVVNAADLVIDTSRMSVHELREIINRRVGKRPRDRMSVLFESFGFKHGIPGDADFVFDARSLPNPYWEPSLRALTGRDEPVVRFLEAQPGVARFIDDVAQFIEARIPEHQAANRRYLTVAIGCTGGQHRSVYIVEQAGRTRCQPLAADRGPAFSAARRQPHHPYADAGAVTPAC